MRFARFINGPNGSLFCTGYQPADRTSYTPRVLLLPPFGEEMNKSRHVLAALVRQLGDAGFVVILGDLSGTGDSAGEFAEATIGRWRADIDTLLDEFAGTGPLHLIGLRFGALLAADAAQRRQVNQIALLHPVSDGKQQLTQLLRLRLAAGLMSNKMSNKMGNEQGSESMADLNARLAAGEGVEAAGYLLNSTLAKEMLALRLDEMSLDNCKRLAWFEVAPAAERPLMPVSQRLLDRWRGRLDTTAEVIACDQFWITQEIAPCATLADRVCQWLHSD